MPEFLQKMPLETVVINCVDDWPQKRGERNNDAFQFLVEWVLQHFVVQATDEVDKAPLMLTIKGVIASI
jgi:hypothetical protein